MGKRHSDCADGDGTTVRNLSEDVNGVPAGHVPVLVDEVVQGLRIRPDGVYVDGTLGRGGHARAVLERLGPRGRFIGLDRDNESLETFRPTLGNDPRVALIHANFERIAEVLKDAGFEGADGILLDLGVSMNQMTDTGRGFSFRSDAPLDMRMDRSGGETAEDLVNGPSERDLADLIYTYGEERASRRIARAIVRVRPIRTCSELADVIRRVMPGGKRNIHPATRTFQALRIAVNGELGALDRVLAEGPGLLRPGGRFCVIAYHSLEDRRVKDCFRDMKGAGYTVLTKKPIRPGQEEIRRNRASRSARLRILERKGEKRGESV